MQIANSLCKGLGSSVSQSGKGKEGRGQRTWWLFVAGERRRARRSPRHLAQGGGGGRQSSRGERVRAPTRTERGKENQA